MSFPLRAGAAAAALAVSILLNAAALRLRPPAPGPLGLDLAPEAAVQTAGLLSLGMRRLAADLELIRLLVYYGSPEPGTAGEAGAEHGHGAFDPDHPEREWGGGSYPELGPRARRALDLDPSFSYPAQFGAAALAFNLDRPQEALELLAYALRRDPSNAQLRAYAAAIGFHRKGDTAAVLRLLEPVLDDPDCPTMIKHIVAFMYRRSGRPRDATRLYLDILEHSRDPGYRAAAERALRQLAAPR